MTLLTNVSRETLADLKVFEGLVHKWSPSINLVAKSTLPYVWERHIEDSALLFSLLPKKVLRLADLGSGGGFPGLVLAILAKHSEFPIETTLIESDQRKAAFLRTVSIDLSLKVNILDQRIEQAISQKADVVTARALAPLPKLLGYVNQHISPEGMALLPKGQGHAEELAQAANFWEFDLKIEPIQKNEGSAVLKFTNLREKGSDGS